MGFVDALGVFQGVIVGIILILIHNKPRKASLFLGIFAIVFGLNLLQPSLFYFGFYESYPEYGLMPINFYWSMFVFFYIYVSHISSLPKSNFIYLLLVPGFIEEIIGIYIFFQEVPVKKEIARSNWYLYHIYGSIIYNIIIGFVTINHINKHVQKIANFHSSIEKKELRWAKSYSIFGIAFLSTHLFLGIFGIDITFIEVLLAIINVSLLYWLTIRGLMQKSLLLPEISTHFGQLKVDPLELKQEPIDPIPTTIKYQEIVDKSNHVVTNKNLFLKPDLTIVELAKLIEVHPKQLSSAINHVLDQNFNTYINNFRVQRVKEKLKTPTRNLTIDAIGLEAGFKSKSSFYNAFRRVTGTTPSKF